MPLETTTLQRWQRSLDLIDPWIAANKPSPSKSQEVFTAFMERYGSGITGSDEFCAKTKRVIEKASRLTAGVIIMQRLLSTGKELILRKTTEDEIKMYDGSPSYFSSPSSLMLNFDGPKILYICLNNQGERAATHRLPNSVVFIHECLHAWHEFTNNDRSGKLSSLPEMDSDEEDLTMTGHLHLEGAADIDFCCEHSALRELNRPLRISHRGFDKETPDLYDWIKHRVFSKIRELSQSDQIHNHKEDCHGNIPLELALHLYLLESHPETMQERMETIRILIQEGCQSEYALEIAILLNSRELMALLLQAGASLTDEMLRYAIQVHDRHLVVWRMLEQKKRVKGNYEKLGRQRQTLKAKFSDNGTLPIHTLKELFCLTNLMGRSIKTSKEFFMNWIQSHSHANPQHATFEFRPDGTCIPSSGRQFAVFPECHKFEKDFGSELPHPFFTPAERECFIKILSVNHIDWLTDSLSNAILKKLNIKHSRFCGDHELTDALSLLIATRITTTPFISATLLKETELPPAHSTCYCDIPIVSEEGDGLLQQIEYNFDTRYPNPIKSLKDEKGKPISSASCRLVLLEDLNLRRKSYHLRFARGILLNDTPVGAWEF